MENRDWMQLPDIPAGEDERERRRFPQYMMFDTVRRGVRRYLCTYCGKKFIHDSVSMRELVTPEDRAWDTMKVNDRAVCPFCGCVSVVKNRKMFTPKWCCDAVVYLIPVSEEYVVARCVLYHKYGSEAVGAEDKIGRTETNVYHLRRGEKTVFYRWDGNRLVEETVREPFLWSHGPWTEKYGYREVWVGAESGRMEQEGTFLRYFPRAIIEQHEYGTYRQGYCFSLMRYLSAYAEHPGQVETLCKVGVFEPVKALADGMPNVRVMDWNAKTPWAMMRLDKQTYEVWKNECQADLDVRKVFRYIKGKGVTDMRRAREIWKKSCEMHYYTERLQGAREDIVAGIRYNGKPDGLYKYIERTHEAYQGQCYRGYVSECEIYNLWKDYTEMVKKAKLEGKAPEFPHNLKERHDQMVGILNKKEAERRKAEKKKEKEAEARRRAELDAKYAEVSKRYAEISDRYAFADDRFRIVVPTGASDIREEGLALCHCAGNTERYYARIASGESYIFFLRRAKKPKKSWYTLEVEPGGTIRQKRTMMDNQNEDLQEAVPFLMKWQEHIRETMTDKDMEAAFRAKRLRIMEMEELQRTGAIVHNGSERGKKLCDVLTADLMEVLYDIKTGGAGIEAGKEEKEA